MEPIMLPVTEKNSGEQRNDPGWKEKSVEDHTEDYSWQKEDTMEKLLDANPWEHPEEVDVQGKLSFTLEVALDIGLGLVFLLSLPVYFLYLLKLSLRSRSPKFQ